MGDDPDSIPEREMKDFQFRQMKKIRVFESCVDLPKQRSSLLCVSNKFGLTFAGRERVLRVFWTRDVIAAGRQEGNPNDTVECASAATVTVAVAMHHMALSSDELTLCVCGASESSELTLDFYDVRTVLNKHRQEKRPFTSFRPSCSRDSLVQDLKWSPVESSRLAVCVSDGSMMVLDVQDSVSVVAQLPASTGITSICWSPKGKQVSAGKLDATVVQFTPSLQAKKVIPCPSFYSQDHPVKVLDVLWLSTFNFAVAYAAADGSLETPPELVVVSLPKKDEKRGERYLNFNDLVYGTCTERQHHYYLCHIEDWDLVLAASAAAIEVSIIAKQEDKVNWELWLQEDASRAELPVTENNEDTLPVGVAIDYTSQEDIQLSDEKRLPPAPTLMLLSTDGVLCAFSLLNLNAGAKQLSVSAVPLPVDGERVPAAQSSSSSAVPVSAASSHFPSFPAPPGTAPPPAFTAPPPASLFTARPPASLASTAPPPAFTATPPASSFTALPPASTAPSTAPPPASTAPPPASTAPPTAPPPASTAPPPASTAPPPASTAPPPASTAPPPASTAPPPASTAPPPASTAPPPASTAPPPASTAPPPASTAPPPASSAPPPASSSFTALPPAASSFTPPPPAFTAPPPASSAPPPTSSAPPPYPSSTGFSFSLPPLGSAAPSGFSLGSTSAGFSFTAPKPSDASAFSFSSSAPSQHLPAVSPIISGPKAPAEPATPAVRMNLTDRFSAVETITSVPTPAQPFSLTSTPKPTAVEVIGPTGPALRPAAPAVSRSAAPPAGVHKAATPASAQVVSVKALEKQLQQKKESDPVMTGIMEEIAHFQKELDDLKTRCRNADFRVGSTEDMRDLRKDSENFHAFTLEIKETTESLHGDISALKTSLLEGFAGAEEARAQSELNRDQDYLQLLYKKPLDPRREEQIKEIRRLYQYVKFAMEDVNGVLDVEWEMHLEKKKKQRHMIVPEREALFAALANNLDIINQQKTVLDRLSGDLHKLRLYRGTSVMSFASRTPSSPSEQSLDRELESLKEALLKASLETTTKTQDKSPSKMTPAKQSQLRNFLSKRQTPPVRSTAPANLSRSAFLCPQFYEDLDELSSSSSLSQVLEPEDSLALAEDEPVLMPSVPRHPTVVRTPSIQPGFSPSPFSRVPIISAAPKINMDSADSTALATKTVKHGAPPTEKAPPTTVPAPQAAARAALSRHMTSQKPGAGLSESTLKTVPHVVNVQELKDKGPHTPVSTVISASVPAPAAQVVQQVLATVEANKSSFQAALKLQSPAQSSASSFVFGGAAKPDAGASSSVSEKNSKGFSFSAPSAGFSFTSQAPDANNTQAKSSGPSGKFSFASSAGSKMPFGGSEEPFSFTPKLASPGPSVSSSTPPPDTPKLPHAPKAQGETLGCFSGLRVGQSEELKDSSKPALGFSFAPPGNGSAGFTFNSAQIKPAEPGSATAESESAATDATKTITPPALGTPTPAAKPQEPAAPSVKPAFTIPSTTFSADATSFGSLLRAPLPETTLPTHSLPPTPTAPELAKEEAKEPPSSKPLTVSAPVVSVNEAAAPVITETITATSIKPPTPPPAPPASVTPPSDTPPAISEPPVAEPVVNPAVETASITSIATPASQETPATTTSDKPGSIFGTDAQAVSFSTAVTTSASSASSTAITTSAAPTFGQSPAAPSAAFGSTAFGATSTSGFGKLAFGQSPAGFGQPAAAGSASSFSFGQAAFSASPGFGTPATTSTATTATGGAAAMFGAASANSASSFSFASGTSTGSAAGTGTGTGVFSQSSAPGFGQPSAGFGQASMFGSSTTTAASSGFGFGQPSGFGSSSSSASVFGQQPSVFGQAPSGAGMFGSSAGNASSGSGFFSGLGGKPSEDAANKNPFGAPAAGGFGQESNTGPANLFGSSGAKAFSFSNNSFGEQKPSGSFSTGAGSVAAQGFGSFSTPTKTAGFGSAPVFGSPPTFGGSPAFGASAGFGSAPSFSAPMGSSGGKVFGEGTTASNVGGFGFASPPNAPSFGSLANPGAATPSFGSPSGFGAQTGAFPGFGSSAGFGGFGNANSNQPSAQTFNSWRS